MTKRILVTGGAGFIGSHLCERLLAEGHEVVCVDNFLTGSERNIAQLHENPKFKFIRHDVTNDLHVAGSLDFVLHFASGGEPRRLREVRHQDAQGERPRDAQDARDREGERGDVPARLDLRGVRRPAGEPAA